MTLPATPSHPPLRLACLCAAWCRTCDAYRATLDAVVSEFVARGELQPARWIDIEDEAELVGDVDIETFPTLLVCDEAASVLFAGPVTPQPETLRRLLASLVAHGEAARHPPDEFTGLAQRLRADSRGRFAT
jgi:thioredoxin-like negative regulator of GroEL